METMNKWKAEITAEGKTLAEEKIQRGIFLGDLLSPLLFLIAMIPLNYILRKCTGNFKFTKSQENIHYHVYRDDIKLFTKNEKRTGNSDTNNKNIQPGMEFGREKCAMLIMKSRKR